MSTTIIIQSKEQRYAEAGAINTVRQIGTTAAVSVVRSGAYKLALSPIVRSDTNETQLLNDGSDVINGVILHTKKGVAGTEYDLGDRIEFRNARINATKKNTIVSTALVNRAGKVKERIQADDYDVTISGDLWVENPNVFPYYELYLLNKILSEAENIYVASKYLEIFGIVQLVFHSADFNQQNLQYFNVMPYTLRFSSDMDYGFLVHE